MVLMAGLLSYGTMTLHSLHEGSGVGMHEVTTAEHTTGRL